MSAAPVLGNGPVAEISKEPGKGRGLVMGVEAAGVGKQPGMAAAEAGLLKSHACVFNPGDDTVWVEADKRDNCRAPSFDLDLQTLAPGAQFVVGEFVGTGGGALDDVGDAKVEVKQEGFFKRREEARREAASIEGRPKAVARTTEMVADGGGIEAGIDADKQDDEVFRDEIGDELVVRSLNLGLGGLPECRQCPVHGALPYGDSTCDAGLVNHTAAAGSSVSTRA